MCIRDSPRELFRQVHGRVRGGEEADERDPDLSHGQETAWVLDEVLDATRSAMALVHKLVYPAVAQGNEGNLGGHEHRLDGDEDKDYQQLKENVAHRSAPSVAGSPAVGAGVAGASAVTSTRGFRRRAGTPTASMPAGTSFVTTDPAPVHAPSPSSTGATSIVSEPRKTFLPIFVLCLRTPSKLQVMVPAPTFVCSPSSASPM